MTCRYYISNGAPIRAAYPRHESEPVGPLPFRLTALASTLLRPHSLVAAVAATLIPIALRALKIDPALASAVFITTLTDMFGFFAFLGLATLFLRYLA